MSDIKKNIYLSILVIFIGLVFAGATFAYLTRNAELTNENHVVNSECFLIDYNVNNENGTKDITGTLFPTGKASGGLNGRVGLKINNSCNMYGTGTLKMHINNTTNSDLTRSISSYCISRSTLEKIDGITTKAACEAENVKGRWMGYGDSYCENPNTLERIDTTEENCTSSGGTWTTGGSPLKYAVYSNSTGTGNPLRVGHITSSDIGNDIILKDDILVGNTQKYYYIYVWLDGYMTDNTFNNMPFSGYINASAIQNDESLPSNYQRVEFLQGSGTQYIDSEYYPDKDTAVYVDYQFTTITKQRRIFGTDLGDTTNTVSYGFYINGSSKWAYAFSDGAGNWINTGVLANTNRHILEFNRNGLVKIDSGTIYSSQISGTVTKKSDYSMFIMARNAMGTTSQIASIKIYSFKIYQNNTLVRNFIPCYNKDTNEKGLYDVVNSKFYTNKGTDTFQIGSEV